MTWLLTAWSWFLSTRIGRGLILVAGLLAAIAGACLYWFERGKHSQADKDKAKDAEAAKRAAQAAQETFAAATDAAAKVQADAAKQAPPDPVKRDDFNTQF